LKNRRKLLTFLASFLSLSVSDLIPTEKKDNYYLRYRNEEKTPYIPLLQKHFVPIARQGLLVLAVDSYK
jgi:hypothetical protein